MGTGRPGVPSQTHRGLCDTSTEVSWDAPTMQGCPHPAGGTRTPGHPTLRYPQAHPTCTHRSRGTPRAPTDTHPRGVPTEPQPPDTALPMGCSTPRETTTVTPPDEGEAAGGAGVPSKVHSMQVGAGGSPGGGCSPRSAPCPAAKRPRDILKPCSRLLPGALPALPAPGLERGRRWGDATPPIAACAPAGRPRTAPGAQGEPGTGLLAGTRRKPPAVTQGHTPLTPLPEPHRPSSPV